LIEFCVGTLWVALKRLGCGRWLEFKGLGERARLLGKDDVLMMWKRGGHTWRGWRERRLGRRGSRIALYHSSKNRAAMPYDVTESTAASAHGSPIDDLLDLCIEPRSEGLKGFVGGINFN
jgi:hypothetical protein